MTVKPALRHAVRRALNNDSLGSGASIESLLAQCTQLGPNRYWTRVGSRISPMNGSLLAASTADSTDIGYGLYAYCNMVKATNLIPTDPGDWDSNGGQTPVTQNADGSWKVEFQGHCGFVYATSYWIYGWGLHRTIRVAEASRFKLTCGDGITIKRWHFNNRMEDSVFYWCCGAG